MTLSKQDETSYFQVIRWRNGSLGILTQREQRH